MNIYFLFSSSQSEQFCELMYLSSWSFIDITIIIEMNSSIHCETHGRVTLHNSSRCCRCCCLLLLVAAAATVAVSFQFVLNTLLMDGFTWVFLGTKQADVIQLAFQQRWRRVQKRYSNNSSSSSTRDTTKKKTTERKKRNYLSNWMRTDVFCFWFFSPLIFRFLLCRSRSRNRETQTYFPFVVIIIFNKPVR